MLFTAAVVALMGGAMASPISEEIALGKRACPNIHVFGARETTAPAGYGTAGVFVNLILNAYPGATSEAINYPACGGQSSCGGVSYADSVKQGISAITSAVNSFNQQCPNTLLVIVGYSQGGQITDDAFCGGGDSPEGYTNTAVTFSSSALNQIKAVILAGDPRHIPGLSYNVGSCQANGFAPRPSGFQCPSASKIQSYCDASDPYCCNGNDANTHQGYGNEYGQAALTFVKGKLGSGTSTGTSPPASSSSTAPSNGGGGNTGSGSCSAKYGQCGGTGWTGPTCCVSGTTCHYQNAYYSQCS